MNFFVFSVSLCSCISICFKFKLLYYSDLQGSVESLVFSPLLCFHAISLVFCLFFWHPFTVSSHYFFHTCLASWCVGCSLLLLPLLFALYGERRMGVLGSCVLLVRVLLFICSMVFLVLVSTWYVSCFAFVLWCSWFSCLLGTSFALHWFYLLFSPSIYILFPVFYLVISFYCFLLPDFFVVYSFYCSCRSSISFLVHKFNGFGL